MEKSHGRIYLPEQLLLWGDGSVRPVTGASEQNLVAGSISPNRFTKGMSPEEIKEQQVTRKVRGNPHYKYQMEGMKLLSCRKKEMRGWEEGRKQSQFKSGMTQLTTINSL